MDRNTILTREEFQELTGCTQRAACIRQIQRNGIPVRIAADGWPIVYVRDVAPHPPRVGLVYVIEAVGAGALKIGFTQGDPRRRMAELQTGSAARLVLRDMMPGTEDGERTLHALCADHRIHGEWFRDRAPVRRILRSWTPLCFSSPLPWGRP